MFIYSQIAHWEAMLAHSGQWVECWHMLRSDMDPQDVDQIEESTLCLPPPITEVLEEEGPESPKKRRG